MTELIIGDVRPRNQYAADGVQLIFPYNFPILDAVDLQVVFNDGDAPGSYTVTDAGLSGGGDVVFDSAPATGTRVSLFRDMPFARETDFQESGDFRASVINEELDRMAMLLQQAEMIVEDGLHKRPYDADDPLILPSSSDRAGKMLGFDGDGLPVTLSDPFNSAAAGEVFADSAAVSADAAAESAVSAAAEAAFAVNQAVPVDGFTGDGVATVFTLSRTLNNSTSALVTIDGVKQHIAGYTVSGVTLTFSTAPPNASAIEVVMIGFVGLIAGIAEVADDALSGDKISGGLTDGVSVDGLNGGPLAGFRNRIINGGFDIWQRGTSFALTATSGNFGPDRWQARSVASVAGTLSRQGSPGSYRMRVQRMAGQTATTIIGVSTVLETSDCAHLAGQDVTVSFTLKVGVDFSPALVRVNVLEGGGVDEGLVAVGGFATSVAVTNNYPVPTTTEGRYSISLRLAAATTQLGLQFWITPVGTAGVDDWYEIGEVQYEIGGVATPFERRSLGIELGLCQRYFLKLGDNSASNRTIGYGFAQGTIACPLFIPTPVTMRAGPSITMGSEHIRCNAVAPNVTSYSAIEVEENGVSLQANVASGLTSSHAAVLVNSGTHLELDAEI